MMLRRLAYAAVPVGVAMARFFPESMHPGKKAGRTLRELGIDFGIGRHRFESNVLLSLWRSMLLLRWGFQAPVEDVENILHTRVRLNAGLGLEDMLSQSGGIILATPHYGAFIPLLMKLSQLCKGRKKFNVIFNDPKVTPSNAQYGELFTRLGCDGSVLYPDRRGTVAALKALKRGECVAILPDVYFESSTTMAVPFLGRLLRVMPGTAFFATRTNSPVVPLYATPGASLGFDVAMGRPIDPSGYADEDEEQSQFRFMTALVSEMERQFRANPVHWNYWASLRERSSRLLDRELVTTGDFIAALQDKLRSSPTLLRRIPLLGDGLAAISQKN